SLRPTRGLVDDRANIKGLPIPIFREDRGVPACDARACKTYNALILYLPMPGARMTDTTALDTLILEILAGHPDGLSEYELLKALRSTAHADMAGAAQSDRLTLFRMHFLL